VPTLSSEGPAPWWDPLGLWPRAGFGGAASAGEMAEGLHGPWNVPQSLFDLLRARLIDRPVSFGTDENAVDFTLTSLEASVGQVAAVSGQVDDVVLHADRVTWRSFRFERVSVRLGNYHTRFGVRPKVVAAPVDVAAALTGEALDVVLARVAPAFRCEITEAGELRVRWSRHAGWGYLQVLPDVVGGELVLRPRALGRGNRACRVPRLVMSFRPGIRLPATVRFTEIELGQRQLIAHLRVDAWTVDLLDVVTWVRR